MYKKTFPWVKLLSILLAVSIILNIGTVILHINTLKSYETEDFKNELINTINASDNSVKILSFYKNQLKLETITKNDYSEQLKELSDIHTTMISLLQEKNYKDLELTKQKTISFLSERKKIFDNLKSAIDLDSSNYYNVASTAEKTANELLNELNILLQ
jgi:hypothetical protein